MWKQNNRKNRPLFWSFFAPVSSLCVSLWSFLVFYRDTLPSPAPCTWWMNMRLPSSRPFIMSCLSGNLSSSLKCEAAHKFRVRNASDAAWKITLCQPQQCLAPDGIRHIGYALSAHSLDSCLRPCSCVGTIRLQYLNVSACERIYSPIWVYLLSGINLVFQQSLAAWGVAGCVF